MRDLKTKIRHLSAGFTDAQLVCDPKTFADWTEKVDALASSAVATTPTGVRLL